MNSVLVIDDEPQVLRGVQRVLSQSDAGWIVRTAGNGREALALLEEMPSDLVITDIFMPESDGLETIRRVRARHPGTKILVMSGGGVSGRTEFLRVAEVLGAGASIGKPFETEDLVAKVRKLLGQPRAGGAAPVSGN